MDIHDYIKTVHSSTLKECQEWALGFVFCNVEELKKKGITWDRINECLPVEEGCYSGIGIGEGYEEEDEGVVWNEYDDYIYRSENL